LPYAGGFDEARAHRFGLEAANARPLMQQLGEPTVEIPLLPPNGSILHLPGSDGETPVLTLHVKPAQDYDGVIVRLLNASDEPHPAELKSGEWQIITAQLCDLLEQPETVVPVENGRLQIILQPRRITTLHLTIRANG
jgi:alpha-mannosidase